MSLELDHLMSEHQMTLPYADGSFRVPLLDVRSDRGFPLSFSAYLVNRLVYRLVYRRLASFSHEPNRKHWCLMDRIILPRVTLHGPRNM